MWTEYYMYINTNAGNESNHINIVKFITCDSNEIIRVFEYNIQQILRKY